MLWWEIVGAVLTHLDTSLGSETNVFDGKPSLVVVVLDAPGAMLTGKSCELDSMRKATGVLLATAMLEAQQCELTCLLGLLERPPTLGNPYL